MGWGLPYGGRMPPPATESTTAPEPTAASTQTAPPPSDTTTQASPSQTPSAPPAPQADRAGARAEQPAGQSQESGSPQASTEAIDPSKLYEDSPEFKRFVDSRVHGSIGSAYDPQNPRFQSALQPVLDRAVQDAQAMWLQDQRLQERARLREENPAEFARRDAEEEAYYRQRQQGQADQQHRAQEAVRSVDTLIAGVWGKVPAELQVKLNEQKWQGATELEARSKFLTALVDNWVEHGVNGRLAPELERVRKEVELATRAETQGSSNGAAGRVNLSGGAAPAGALIQSEWDQNRANRAWRTENAPRVEEAINAGRIRY